MVSGGLSDLRCGWMIGGCREASRHSVARCTCQYSSSTGVNRPKMETEILSLPRSGSISSMRPVRLAKAPSVIFTSSPTVVRDLRHFLAVGGLDAGPDLVDLGLAQRGGMIAADKTDHAGDFLHEVPRLVDQLLVLAVEAHLDEDVARIELADLRGLLAGLHLGNDLGRQQHFENMSRRAPRLF